MDYILPSFAMKESNWEKNILSFHSQDFNRAFVLFFPYKYPHLYSFDRWDNNLISDNVIINKYLDYDKRNLGSINFKKIDLLVIPRNFSYPKNLFEIIQERNSAILIKKRFDFENETLFINKKINIFDLKKYFEINDKNNLLIKFYDKNNICFYFYGDDYYDFYKKFKENDILNIEYFMIIKNKNKNINNDFIKNIYYFCD
ncbi:MAG: hypothetical protein N2114_02525 [Candidatus Goldbacteria bacterium]|nr:hypothetical protein [Candidatus Goldiibacteriota bacterium]